MKLKIISLNIWIGGLLMEEVMQFLRAEAADILLLQEVFDGEDPQLRPNYRSLSILKQEFGQRTLERPEAIYPYMHFAPAFLERVEYGRAVENGKAVKNGKAKEIQIPQGSAIFSKFPLKEIGIIFYDRPFGERINTWEAFTETPRNLQHVVADLGADQGTDLHPRYLHLLNTQGIWGEDGGDSPRRLAMGETIIQEIKSIQDHPFVLAGDFNLRPNTQTISNIEKYARNVFKAELETGMLRTTFNLKRKDLKKFPGYADAMVDMMLVSHDVRVVNRNVPEVDVSDHLPLVVEVEIN